MTWALLRGYRRSGGAITTGLVGLAGGVLILAGILLERARRPVAAQPID